MRKRTEDSFLLKNLDDADELPTFAQKRKKMYETVAQSAIRKPKTGRRLQWVLFAGQFTEKE